MSQKPDDFNRLVTPESRDTLGNNAVSCNGCPDASAESDSESESALVRREWPEAVVRRFWAKVDRNGPIPEHCPNLGRCWIWTANKVKGYGQFTYRLFRGDTQHHVYAHRFAYELAYGSLAGPHRKACHRCDTTLCCNPAHIFEGSQADNLSDARRKGRLIDGLHNVKISDAQAAEIRRRYIPRKNGKALAREYGIALTTLIRIVGCYERVVRPFDRVFERVPHRQAPIVGVLRTQTPCNSVAGVSR